MQQTPRERRALWIYLIILVAIAVIVIVSARDVIFERFTFRIDSTVVADGDLVYAVGGRSLEGVDFREVLVMDPVKERIHKAPGLEIDLYGQATAAVDGAVILAGGTTATGFSDGIYRFDRETDEFLQIGTLPFPMAYAAAAAIDGDVIITGGYDGTSRRAEIMRVDPDTGDAWVIAMLPEPRDGHSAVANGSSIIISGGQNSDSIRFADILEIDPPTGAVIRTIALPSPLRNQSMAVHDGRLTVLGTDERGRDHFLTLDLAAQSSQFARRPTDLDARRCTLVVANDQLLAVGDAHPTVGRQLGVWLITDDARSVEALRYHSRIWQ